MKPNTKKSRGFDKGAENQNSKGTARPPGPDPDGGDGDDEGDNEDDVNRRRRNYENGRNTKQYVGSPDIEHWKIFRLR